MCVTCGKKSTLLKTRSPLRTSSNVSTFQQSQTMQVASSDSAEDKTPFLFMGRGAAVRMSSPSTGKSYLVGEEYPYCLVYVTKQDLNITNVIKGGTGLFQQVNVQEEKRTDGAGVDYVVLSCVGLDNKVIRQFTVLDKNRWQMYSPVISSVVESSVESQKPTQSIEYTEAIVAPPSVEDVQVSVTQENEKVDSSESQAEIKPSRKARKVVKEEE